jgi:hypothetical protein
MVGAAHGQGTWLLDTCHLVSDRPRPLPSRLSRKRSRHSCQRFVVLCTLLALGARYRGREVVGSAPSHARRQLLAVDKVPAVRTPMHDHCPTPVREGQT